MGVPRVALTMSQLLTLVCCFLLSTLTARASYDSYQDALDKYAKWHQRHGLPSRVERNVEKNVVRDAVFVPHRPRDGGAKFVISSPLTLTEFEKEVTGPDVFRNTRQQGNYQAGPGLLSTLSIQLVLAGCGGGRVRHL